MRSRECEILAVTALFVGYVFLGFWYATYFYGYYVETLPYIISIMMFTISLMACKIDTLPDVKIQV